MTDDEYDEEDPYEFPENEYEDPAMMGHLYQNKPHTYQNVHTYLKMVDEPDYQNTLEKDTGQLVPTPNHNTS